MKSRLAGSLALALSVVFGTVGCSMISPQATTLHYDPSDGIGGVVGDIKIENAFLVTENGTNANLIAVLTNRGDSSHTVEIQYKDNGTKAETSVTVLPGARAQVGFGAGGPVELDDVDVPAGSLAPVFFQYGQETGVLLDLPVLNTELPEYENLAPEPSETPAG